MATKKDRKYFRNLLKINRLKDSSMLTEEQLDKIEKDITLYNRLVLPERWVVKQRSSRKICDWHSKKFGSNASMLGRYEYLIGNRMGFCDSVPSDYTILSTEEVERLIDAKLI